MDNERFDAIGRAIYRFFETDPKDNGPAQAQLMEGLEKVKAFLEAQLPLKMDSAQDSSPSVDAARRQVVDDIREEIKWVNASIAWFQEGEKRVKIFDLAQYEANKAMKKA